MNAPEQSAARRRLARLIERRAGELDLDWNDVAELAGITKEGLRGVRYGDGKMRIKTKAGLEKALQWTTGSIDTILGGGDPAPRTPARSPMDETEELAAENVERARRIGRLRRDQRRLVDDLVRMLEADTAGSQDHDRNPR